MHTFGPNPSSSECPSAYTILAKVSKDTQCSGITTIKYLLLTFSCLLQAVCLVSSTMNTTFWLSPMAMAGVIFNYTSLRPVLTWKDVLCLGGMQAYVILHVSLQVYPDCSMGGIRWRVQYFLLQIWLQCQHSIPHQTLLWGKEAQDNCRYFVSQ